MQRVGLVFHPKIAEAHHLAKESEAGLSALGARPQMVSAWDEEAVARLAETSDLVVTFGGDGTIVRVARTVAVKGLPVLGVNMGRLGFLAELQPWQVPQQLRAILNGEYWIEERMMLHADLKRDSAMVRSFEALNDVVAGRGRIARVVRVDTHINDAYLTTYTADGVIVASPTGSTAYSLAAGGPIVGPGMRALLLTPIAPHRTVAQSLVLPATASVRLAISTEYEATLTVDGHVDVPLGDGDEVWVAASKHVSRFVRFGDDGYFYQTLLERLK